MTTLMLSLSFLFEGTAACAIGNWRVPPRVSFPSSLWCFSPNDGLLLYVRTAVPFHRHRRTGGYPSSRDDTR